MGVDPTIAAAKVLGLIDEKIESFTFLAKGATSRVWRLRSEKGTYAFKIIDANDSVLNGDIDRFLRLQIIKNGGRVSVPILDSESCEPILGDLRWALDSFVLGNHPARGGLSEETCVHLGQTLAILHQIPVKNYGSPLNIDAGSVIGKKPAAMEGVGQRFENPLPELWASGFIHPAFDFAPEIENKVKNRLREVSAIVHEGARVLCHADIHEKQLLCDDKGLVALIDFGDVTLLDRHWGLGAVLYFHGPQVFARVHEAYSAVLGSSISNIKITESFSIAIAMHHASRSTKPGKTHRLSRAVDYIRTVLDN